MDPIECAIDLSISSDDENDDSVNEQREEWQHMEREETGESEDDEEDDEDDEDDEDEESEDEHNPSELKDNLLFTLSEIKSSGSFMTQKSELGGVNPGLHVSGVGTIGLPISTDHAKAMIESSRMSPYGKGTETLVNESVRKSWQLDVNQFSLQNPVWETQLGLLRKDAIAGLGLTTAKPEEVKLELYKLLIYEEGAFFLPHQDSEKADGMFATLVISLPSKHEGGDVIASHKGQSLKFHTASNSEYGFSWAAWYADVMHEVKPVQSGYRIVLVYNLIHRPSAALMKYRGDQVGTLSELLAAWTSTVENSKHHLQNWTDLAEKDCPAALVYILDHKYSIAELSVTRLKGVDRYRFVQLQEACRKNDCDIYLANIEKTVTGGAEDDYDHYGGYGGYYGRGRRLNDKKGFHKLFDVYEKNLELLHVVDTQGAMAGKKLSFSESMVIQSHAFRGDPDDEEYEGFTGNEGASATHFFRQTGILIIPRTVSFLFEIERLKKDQGDIKGIMQECEQLLSQQSDKTMAKKGLAQVCSILTSLRYTSDTESRQKFIDLIMKKALELGDFELFGRALLLINTFSSSHITLIAKVIADHGLNSLRPYLNSKLKLKREDKYGYGWGSRSAPALELLYRVTREYHSICTQENRKLSTEVVDWQNMTFLDAVSSGMEGSESDGQKFARQLNEMPILGSLAKIEAFLLSHLDNTTFALSFIFSTNQCSLGNNLENDVVGAMIKSLLPKVIHSFKVEHASHLTFRDSNIEYGHYRSYNSWQKNNRVAPSLVIKLIQLANSTNIDTGVITAVLLKYANNVKGDAACGAWNEFLFPVATGILDHTTQTKRQPTAEEKDFITGLLKVYVGDYVKKARTPPADWKARTTVRCTCPDCKVLSLFIDDQDKKTEDFAMAGSRRKHLEQQLDRSYFKTETIKRGSPHILRVEKTNAMLVSYYNTWIKRAKAAKVVLNQLSRKGSLKEILGEADYRTIFEHTNLQVPDEIPFSSATTTNARPAFQSTVPQKRSWLS